MSDNIIHFSHSTSTRPAASKECHGLLLKVWQESFHPKKSLDPTELTPVACMRRLSTGHPIIDFEFPSLIMITNSDIIRVYENSNCIKDTITNYCHNNRKYVNWLTLWRIYNNTITQFNSFIWVDNFRSFPLQLPSYLTPSCWKCMNVIKSIVLSSCSSSAAYHCS